MFKRLKRFFRSLRVNLERNTPITLVSEFLVKNFKHKALALSLIFGLPEFLLISILLLDRMDQVKHGLDVLLMVYLASIWAWVGPLMIWKYEKEVIPNFLSSAKKTIKDKEEYKVFFRKHKKTIYKNKIAKIYVISWTLFISYIFIDSYSYIKNFGLSGTDDIYWYLMVAGVAFYAYLTANGFLFVIKTILILKDILTIAVNVDPERVKQIETGLLKNKTTNRLFWQPIM